MRKVLAALHCWEVVAVVSEIAPATAAEAKPGQLPWPALAAAGRAVASWATAGTAVLVQCWIDFGFDRNSHFPIERKVGRISERSYLRCRLARGFAQGLAVLLFEEICFESLIPFLELWAPLA